jgi:hypothetical protein
MDGPRRGIHIAHDPVVADEPEVAEFVGEDRIHEITRCGDRGAEVVGFGVTELAILDRVDLHLLFRGDANHASLILILLIGQVEIASPGEAHFLRRRPGGKRHLIEDLERRRVDQLQGLGDPVRPIPRLRADPDRDDLSARIERERAGDLSRGIEQ